MLMRKQMEIIFIVQLYLLYENQTVVVSSNCWKVVAGAGSVKSSAGTWIGYGYSLNC